MFLAMPQFAYDELIKFDFVQEVISDISLKLIVFDENTNEIVIWKN